MSFSRLKKQKITNYYNRLRYLKETKKYTVTISKEYKFVWYQVAKVGTRTILNTLRESNVPLYMEDAYHTYVPPKPYEDYFKFAFIRNPYDRIVSCWLNKVYKRTDNRFKASKKMLVGMQTFSGFIDFVETLDLENCDEHIKSQSSLIDLSDINYIGRMEHFEQDVDEVFCHLGIKSKKLAVRNVTKSRKNYQEYYSENDIKRVSKLYKKDIQIFGYKF